MFTHSRGDHLTEINSERRRPAKSIFSWVSYAVGDGDGWQSLITVGRVESRTARLGDGGTRLASTCGLSAAGQWATVSGRLRRSGQSGSAPAIETARDADVWCRGPTASHYKGKSHAGFLLRFIKLSQPCGTSHVQFTMESLHPTGSECKIREDELHSVLL